MQQPPYSQSIFYNSESNIGGTFANINESIEVESSALTEIGLEFNLNSLYVAAGDGIIYSSTHSGLEWSPWNQVGQNQLPLGGVYINDNKVYSIYESTNVSQIYVYSLD